MDIGAEQSSGLQVFSPDSLVSSCIPKTWRIGCLNPSTHWHNLYLFVGGSGFLGAKGVTSVGPDAAACENTAWESPRSLWAEVQCYYNIGGWVQPLRVYSCGTLCVSSLD
ncbi:uncharacterized protein LOC144196528 isoform X2 [Stigmatopora nigra]